jgi:hypothetical protein
MRCRRISQLIQMRSIGISDTTSVDSPLPSRGNWRIVGPAPHALVAQLGAGFHLPRAALGELVANNPSLPIAAETRNISRCPQQRRRRTGD